MAQAPIRILGVCGSLRKESYNLFALKAAQRLIASPASITIADISKLPLFNQDTENEPNAEVKKFKDLVSSHDAILFSTPEYNYSLPGVLKNAIDVASRPYGQNSWKGKPVGIISSSIGMLGGIRAQLAIRQSLVFLDCPSLNAPEVLIGQAQNKFDKAGNLTDENTAKFLQSYVNSLVEFARKFKQPASKL